MIYVRGRQMLKLKLAQTERVNKLNTNLNYMYCSTYILYLGKCKDKFLGRNCHFSSDLHGHRWNVHWGLVNFLSFLSWPGDNLIHLFLGTVGLNRCTRRLPSLNFCSLHVNENCKHFIKGLKTSSLPVFGHLPHSPLAHRVYSCRLVSHLLAVVLPKVSVHHCSQCQQRQQPILRS